MPNLISKKHTNSAATGKRVGYIITCEISNEKFPSIFLCLWMGFTFIFKFNASVKYEAKPILFLSFTVLYAFFGLRLLYIAWRSSDSKTSQKKEMEEVCFYWPFIVNTCHTFQFCVYRALYIYTQACWWCIMYCFKFRILVNVLMTAFINVKIY